MRIGRGLEERSLRAATMATTPRIVDIPPRFRVVNAPWEGTVDERTIVLGTGGAFGDGRHESTRMCLQAIAAFAPRDGFRLLASWPTSVSTC